MEEEKLQKIVSKNLSDLRKSRKLTQQELAEAIGYSDKSISKWELGKAIPTVDILIKFAEFYEVDLNFLVVEHGDKIAKDATHNQKYKNQVIITVLAGVIMILVGAAVYINSLLTRSPSEPNLWIIWVATVPAACLAAIIFVIRFWKHSVAIPILLSIIAWSIIATFYLIFECYLGGQNIWFIFLVGIPIQVIIILIANLKK